MPRPGRTLQLAVVVTAFVALAFAAGNQPSPPDVWVATADDRWLDTGDRDAVLQAFRAEFATVQPEPSWAGDHATCDPGANTAAYRAATIRRVNFYRAMAGVPGDVVVDLGYSRKAQRAAMMMSAQGELTHDPDASFACFTDVGREAAANSNLYLGRTGPAAVDGYVEDPGDRNIDVGHRATILHPPTERMGVGDIGRSAAAPTANALWVFDERVFDEDSPRRPALREPARFVAWPPRGYVPPVLVHPRWSFTLAGAEFAAADVSLYRSGPDGSLDEVPVAVIHRSGEVGHVPLPTIVWEPELELTRASRAETDTAYVVVIENVGVGGAERSFSYEVRVIGAQPSPELTVDEFVARLAS